MNDTIEIFKASALWADAFYKSKCPSVCLSVCPSLCSLLRYRLNVFLSPLPGVGCPTFLEVPNPWGKSNGKKRSQMWSFLLKKCSKIVAAKKKKNDKFFSLCSLHLNVFVLQLLEVQCPNVLDFPNSWGKLMERSGLRFEYFSS